MKTNNVEATECSSITNLTAIVVCNVVITATMKMKMKMKMMKSVVEKCEEGCKS
jgi:hypothetical protein